MRYAAASDEYITQYLCWPNFISRECPECQFSVQYAHSDNGKKIRTLEGIFYQIIHYYTCTNPECRLHGEYFNPADRLDFGRSYYGKDVMRRITREILVF